jgi:hypothetical protein
MSTFRETPDNRASCSWVRSRSIRKVCMRIPTKRLRRCQAATRLGSFWLGRVGTHSSSCARTVDVCPTSRAFFMLWTSTRAALGLGAVRHQVPIRICGRLFGRFQYASNRLPVKAWIPGLRPMPVARKLRWVTCSTRSASARTRRAPERGIAGPCCRSHHHSLRPSLTRQPYRRRRCER